MRPRFSKYSTHPSKTKTPVARRLGGHWLMPLRLLLVLLLWLPLIAALVAAFALAEWADEIPKTPDLATLLPAQPSEIVARDGWRLAGAPAGEPVAISDLPPEVVAAFIAAEDAQFFEHRAFNLSAILRAALVDLRTGAASQGASTITQQLAKRFLSPEKTLRRKFNELLLARRIEANYRKSEILGIYLNSVFFGQGANGISQASWTYFDKPAPELQVGEAALLASILPAPSLLNPVSNPERARQNRDQVLGKMRRLGLLSEAEYAREIARALALATPRNIQAERMPYAVESGLRALEFVAPATPSAWSSGGYRVRVAHQPRAQAHARHAVRDALQAHDRRQGFRGALGRVRAREKIDPLLEEQDPHGDFILARVASIQATSATILSAGGAQILNLEDAEWAAPAELERHFKRPARLRDLRDILAVDDLIFVRRQRAKDASFKWLLVQEPSKEGAFIALDSRSGALIASVGGMDADRSIFQRAEQGCRQPGSVFKPIVYAEALAQGLTPATMLSDLPGASPTGRGGAAGEQVWQPTNADRDFRGYILLADALAQSRNIPTIHLMNYLGIERVIARAKRLGIESEIAPTASAALGASCVRPVELAEVYAAIQRHGRPVKTSSVATIYDASGQIIFDRDDFAVADWSSAARLTRMAQLGSAPARPGVSAQIAYIVAHLLRRVATAGTAHKLPDAWKVAAKTGTTNRYDGWFVGFDGEMTGVAWVGSDANTRALGAGEHGATVAMPVFESFYAHYFRPEPAIWTQDAPRGIVWQRIDRRSGLRAHSGEAGVDFPFIQGSAPTEFAPTRAARQAEQIDALSQEF